MRHVAYDPSTTLTSDPKTYPDLYARTLPTGLIIRRTMLYLRDLWLRYRRSVLIGSLALIVLSVPILSYV